MGGHRCNPYLGASGHSWRRVGNQASTATEISFRVPMRVTPEYGTTRSFPDPLALRPNARSERAGMYRKSAAERTHSTCIHIKRGGDCEQLRQRCELRSGSLKGVVVRASDFCTCCAAVGNSIIKSVQVWSRDAGTPDWLVYPRLQGAAAIVAAVVNAREDEAGNVCTSQFTPP